MNMAQKTILKVLDACTKRGRTRLWIIHNGKKTFYNIPKGLYAILKDLTK
jgi:rRNA maturation protein Rpf1